MLIEVWGVYDTGRMFVAKVETDEEDASGDAVINSLMYSV